MCGLCWAAVSAEDDVAKPTKKAKKLTKKAERLTKKAEKKKPETNSTNSPSKPAVPSPGPAPTPTPTPHAEEGVGRVGEGACGKRWWVLHYGSL